VVALRLNSSKVRNSRALLPWNHEVERSPNNHV
jgi:hypothetical protein